MMAGNWSRATEEAWAVDWQEMLVGVKRGEEEAMEELRSLVEKGEVEREMGKSVVVPVLLNSLGAELEGELSGRVKILALLRLLVLQFEPNKEIIIELGALSNIAHSLSNDTDEVREALHLLLSVADAPKFRQRIGRVPGCIKKLVHMLTLDDPHASDDSKKLLHALSGNVHNVLLMAEAGYFQFVLPHLQEGSDMNKILVASAIAKMELSDEMKANLGEVSIGPLVQMFRNGKLEAKLSSLSALQNLARLSENIPLLIHHGIVNPLLQLLFSVTSVLLTLREPVAAILASVAQSELIIPMHKDIAQQMFPLLSLSNPSIQHHILQALNHVASHPEFSKVGPEMRGSCAIQLILPFLTSNNKEMRLAALNLLQKISKFLAGDFAQKMGENHLKILVDIISASSAPMEEKVSAIGVLNNIPASDKTTTEILMRTNLLPAVLSLLSTYCNRASSSSSSSPSSPSSSSSDAESDILLEDVAGLLIRFTVPSEKKLQSVCARLGMVPLLVKLLSCGSPIVWSRAAYSLAQLSQNSLSLAKSKTHRWMCAPPLLVGELCAVHNHSCSIQGTFCLVKADAVPPLVGILGGEERGADEQVLLALSTLLQDEVMEGGSSVIEKASGVEALLKVIRVGNSKTRVKAVWMLERILWNDALRQKYGENVVPLLTDLQQTAGSMLLSTMIAKILVDFKVLQTHAHVSRDP